MEKIEIFTSAKCGPLTDEEKEAAIKERNSETENLEKSGWTDERIARVGIEITLDAMVEYGSLSEEDIKEIAEKYLINK